MRPPGTAAANARSRRRADRRPALRSAPCALQLEGLLHRDAPGVPPDRLVVPRSQHDLLQQGEGLLPRPIVARAGGGVAVGRRDYSFRDPPRPVARPPWAGGAPVPPPTPCT